MTPVASFPAGNYTRPNPVHPNLTSVTVTAENGKIKTYEFADTNLPSGLMQALAAGFAAATTPGGRWRTIPTANAAAELGRRFARDIVRINPGIETVQDIGPEDWWTWRSEVEQRTRWPGQINLARALLADTPGVSDVTLRALRSRARKPKKRSYDAYSREEFARIRSAALRILRQGEHRQRVNSATLAEYLAGDEPADAPRLKLKGTWYTAGSILHSLRDTGRLPYTTHYRADRVRQMVDLTGATTILEAMHANTLEVYSLMVLFVCERGLNSTVISDMTIDTTSASDPRSEALLPVVHADKPRRGADRHFDLSLSGAAGKLWERAVALTASARATLDNLGHPTDQLFVARIAGGMNTTHPSRIFRVDWSEAFTAANRWHSHTGLLDDTGEPLRVNLRRLRLTEQVLNEQPRQNTATVHESVYRLPDPHTQEQATNVILGGQQDAIDHARTTVHIRSLTPDQVTQATRNPAQLAGELGVSSQTIQDLVAGRLDTAVTGCLDYYDSPHSKTESGTCAASFLACLSCVNAVATPAHLTRLVTLHDALLRTASAVDSDTWQTDFADAFSSLAHLLANNTTEQELEQARTQARDKDRQIVDRLLRRRLDA